MKKSLITLIAIFLVSNVSLNCYEYKSSNNFKPGHAAWLCGDENNETYWQLRENQTEGFITISGEVEKKSKIFIQGELSSGSKIQLYTDGGNGKKAISGSVKYGPFEGAIEFEIPDSIRAGKEIQIVVSGDKASESKIYEVKIETATDTEEWGKIKPYSYTINIEENINLKADRLWDGRLENAWFEPNWYIPWDISGNSKENRGEQIFGTYTGYPSKEAEIIWNLDGEYEISTVKAYLINSWRCVRFEYEENGEWKQIADLGPYGQKNNSWQRSDVYGIYTSKIRITFPNGWEQARFLSEIEIWGNRKNVQEVEGSGSKQLYGTYDDEKETYWYIFDTSKKDLEIEVTYNGLKEKTPYAQINNKTLLVKNETIINGNNVIVYSIDREELRTGKQFLSIKDTNVETVIIRDYKDDGIVEINDDADIERILVIYEDGNTEIIEGNGKKLSSIDLKKYKDCQKHYFGSLCRDKGVSVELYRPLTEDEQWNGCIIGMIGDSQTNVNASGYGLSRADRVFWTPVSNVDFYRLKGKLKISAENKGRKTEYEYIVKGGKKQKGGYLTQNETLEYTSSDNWLLTGKVYDKASKVYINGKLIEKESNGTFSKSVELSEGYQCITVEAVNNGNTVGYWTKEIYRYNKDGIIISLNGDENGVITRENEYKLTGNILNCLDAKVTVNGQNANIENGKFEYIVKLEEGNNKVIVKAEDAYLRTKEIELIIVKDTKVPVVEIEYPENGAYISSSTIVLSIKADEKDYWYSLNGEEAEYCSNENYKKEIQLSDGFYNWTLTVKDSAGNKTQDIEIKFCIDVTSPQAFKIIPDRETTSENWRNDGTLTVQFETSDETSGIKKYEYTWGNPDWIECSSPLSFSELIDGKHTLYIRAVDNADNTTLSVLDVYTDITNPVNLEVSASIEERKWTNVSSFALYTVAEDSTSGIQKYTITVDNEKERIWNSGDELSIKEDGIHQIEVKAYDKAGNSVSSIVEYYIDATKPESFEVSFNVNGWTNNVTPEAVFETVDNCSGLDHYEISTNNGQWETITSPYVYPILVDGIHTSKFRAYDKAGNYTETINYELKIDTIPPKSVKNYRLIPGNCTMEGKWESDDDDIIAYHLKWKENDSIQDITTSETSYKKNGLINGTSVKMTIQAEDKAHNVGPVVETSLALTGVAIVPLRDNDATLVEYNNIKMAIPPMSPDSNIKGVMIKELDSPTLQEKSVNPIISPIYSFTTLVDKDGNGELTETEHTSFKDEVLVLVSYDDSIVPNGFPEANLEVYYYDDLWGRWFRTEKAGIDIEQNIIIFATNHFTNFSIQPTLLEDLSPEELKKAGHAYGNSESKTGDISVSPESGTMLTEATEFVIHGKNGFEFPIKRIYDTQTARLDGPSLQTQLTLGMNFNGNVGTTILKQLKGAGASLVTSTLMSSLKNYYIRNGDYNLAMGAGWRLSLPYVMADNNNVLVRLPNGSYYSTNQMDEISSNNTFAISHNLVLENHIGDDFTLSVKLRKTILKDLVSSINSQSLSGTTGALTEIFNSIVTFMGQGSVTSKVNAASNLIDWVIEESTLTMKDGLQYKFGPLGYITEISDPSRTNVIKFEYEGLKIKKIIDPNGNEILFEYNELSFLRPYITKISAKAYNGEDRTWLYSYETDKILNLVANSLFCVLPQLKTVTDPENRITEYEVDYSDSNVLVSGGGSVKLNIVLAILDIWQPVSAVKDLLGVYSLTLTARFGIEWPQFITKIKAPEKGVQTVEYSILDLSVFKVEPADYFLSLLPTAVKFSFDYYQKLIAKSVTIQNGLLSRKTNYNYTFEGYGSQHLVTNSIIDDGNQTIINTYYVQSKKYYRYTCIDDNVTEVFKSPTLMTEDSNYEKAYYTHLKSKNVDTRYGGDYEETDYIWDGNNRLKSESTKRGLITDKKEYQYDNWGNIISEKETQTSRFGTIQKTILSQYFNTSSPSIRGFPDGIETTETQVVSGLRNLLIAQSVNDGYLTVYTGNVYDKYGRKKWSGIYTDESKWAATSLEYYPVTGKTPLTDGLIKKLTSQVNQVTDYTYETFANSNTLITTATVLLPVVEESIITTKRIVTKNGTNILTGLLTFSEDGNGNITEYEYDKLGRQVKIKHPGNIYESIVYDDKNHIISVYKDGNKNPAEKYVYDELNNLISNTKYNYVEEPSSITISLGYDKYNNLISITDQNGNITKYDYDSCSRLIKQTNPDNSYVSISYDDPNAIKTTRDENGNVVEEYMNFFGLPERKDTYNNGRAIIEKTIFDGNGRPVKIQDGIGQITEISYSVFGKEKLRKLPSFIGENGNPINPFIRIDYDERGLEKRIQKGDGNNILIIENEYDGLGRKKKVTEEFENQKRIIKYEYDNNENVVKETDEEGYSKQYQYTERNKVKIQIDSLGNKTEYEYDRDDNVVRMTDAEGETVIYIYNGFKRLIKADLPAVPGNSESVNVKITYDNRGNVLTLKNYDGKLTTWKYDSRNRKLSEVISGDNAESIRNSWTYDKVGNVLKETIGDSVTENIYDNLNRIVKRYFPDGQKEKYTYDDISRVIKKEDSIGISTFEFNSLNKITKSVDGLNNVIIHYYDVFGNEIKTVYENNTNGSGDQIWVRKADAWNQIIEESNNHNQKWTYTYDKRGLLITQTDPSGTIIKSIYDGNGNKIEEIRKNNNRTETKSYTYDKVGFMYQATDNGIVSKINYNNSIYVPNAWGLITDYETIVDGKSLKTKFSYDQFQNNTSIIYPNNKIVKWSYNGLGQVTDIGDNQNSTRYASSGTYNSSNYPVSITAGNGTKRNYEWNKRNNLLTGYDWGIPEKTKIILDWDDRGNIISEKTKKTSKEYGYDTLNRLVNERTNVLIEQKGSKEFTPGYTEDDVTGSNILSFGNKNIKFDYFASSIGYSLNGKKKINSIQITGKSDRLNEKYIEIYVSNSGNEDDWTRVNSETLGFAKTGTGLKIMFKNYIETSFIKIHSTWDERDEFYLPKNMSEISGNIADIVEVYYLADGKENRWAYDAKGNRISTTEYIGSSSIKYDIEYYPNCDLLKKYNEWYFNYDANGNLIQRGKNASFTNGKYDYSTTSGEIWEYEYDLSNRLIKVLYSENGTDTLISKASYIYDYRGLCVEKKTDDIREFKEYTGDGKLIYIEETGDSTCYIYRNDNIFAEIRNENNSENIYYHHINHLGTTQVITDENGSIVWEAEFEAFGSTLSKNGTKMFTVSYTGKLYDEDIGMYYFNARWYDSDLGRFITQDPIRDGLNWWNYCNGNPLLYVDYYGLENIDFRIPFEMHNLFYTSDNLGNSDSITIGEQGCYLMGTTMAELNLQLENPFSMKINWNIPSTINNNKQYGTNDSIFGTTDNDKHVMDGKKFADKYNLEFDWWTREKNNGDLGKKIDYYDSLDTKYAVLGKVAYNKNNPNTENHWVGIVGSSKIIDDTGIKYVQIQGTSKYDNLQSRPNFWKEIDGKYYIPTTKISIIHLFSQKPLPSKRYSGE
ncbi:RHS repeat-associated core domain-containing protein [Treponema bryantii]|uniref:RHS repeat-associated core domain-containing protein n=1 Tax=Treponema bryantii TaxID=163 RepID=A0A1H9HA49_9SPIR|nr:RHS repeat-associated core domain-containing protein [Treponema bryantii]SEQ59156.1 RHS repeat-associated core domain-containing protein [Treponema bryantii]